MRPGPAVLAAAASTPSPIGPVTGVNRGSVGKAAAGGSEPSVPVLAVVGGMGGATGGGREAGVPVPVRIQGMT